MDSWAASVRASERVGRTIARKYLLEAVLGEGGMGVVYRGRHLGLGQSVAIKVLLRAAADDTELEARLRRALTSAMEPTAPLQTTLTALIRSASRRAT